MLQFAQFVAEHALGSGRIGGAKLAKGPGQDLLSVVPDDILSSIIAMLDVKALLSIQQCDKRLQRLAGSEKLWQKIFMSRFGLPSKIQETAHTLAGSWQVLYKSKVLTDQAAGQWRKPSPFELQAALKTMIQDTPTTPDAAPVGTPAASAAADAGGARMAPVVDADNVGSTSANTAAGGGLMSSDEAPGSQESGGSPMRQASSSSSSGSSSLSSSASIDSGIMNNTGTEGKTQLALIFLLDSSGSVGDEDFTCMTDFLDTAAQAVAGVNDCKVCVVQFSNDTRVEVPLGPLDKPAFDAAIRSMVRLNGGTNIAAAVAKAGSLLKADEASCSSGMRRVLVLLTDGRIDGYQAREAASMVARLSDEQSNVALWAFGVGRGVDSAELIRIIEGPGETCKGLGQQRYLDLCVRDDAPW